MSTAVTFPISPSTNQIDIIKSGPAYSAANFNGYTAYSLNNPDDLVERSKVGTDYYVTNVLLSFVTSSIPNDAIIESAVLNIYIVDAAADGNATTRYLQVQSTTDIPALSSFVFDYMTTGNPDILNRTSLQNCIDNKNTLLSLSLANPADAVNVLSNTRFRLTIGASLSIMVPNGYNYVTIPSNVDTVHPSPTLTVTYSLPLPGPPTNVTATATGTTSFDVHWTAPSGGATSYLLDVSPSSAFTSFITGNHDRSISGTSASVTGLSASTTYYIRLRSVNANGTGPTYSATTSVTTSSAVSNKTITNTGSGADSVSLLRTHIVTLTDAASGAESLAKATSAITDKNMFETGHAIDAVFLENSIAKTITDSGRGFESIGDYDYIQTINYLSYVQSTFEEDVIGYTPLGSATLAISTLQSKAGTNSLEVTGAVAGDGAAFSGLTRILPNTAYTLSGWLRADSGANDVTIAINLYAQDQSFITSVFSTVTDLSSAWAFFQLNFLASPETYYISPLFTLALTQSMVFNLDALELRRGTSNITEVLLAPTQDAFIHEIAPNFNYGVTENGALGRSATGGNTRSRYLIQFDFSSIPVTADVQNTFLSLYKTQNNGLGAGLLHVYALRTAWNEGTHNNAQATTGEVTWNDAEFDVAAWGNPGASNGMITPDSTTESILSYAFVHNLFWRKYGKRSI